MAALIPATTNTSESDYGSDFSDEEESLVAQILDKIQDNGRPHSLKEEAHRAISVTQADVDAALAAGVLKQSQQDDQDHSHVAAAERHNVPHDAFHRFKGPARLRGVGDIEDALQISSLPRDSVNYPVLSHALTDPESRSAPATISIGDSSEPPPAKDPRAPIERFRSFPKKPLSVTDISSGAWCELQYLYTLSLLPGGRKTRTAAMRGGTKVHETLEAQVHTTIQIDVTRKEEAFALRLWNVIQGLRTLRDPKIGLTRELEVWGVVEGQVINGVIDELSWTSPDPGFEKEISHGPSSKDDEAKPSQKQSSLAQYFTPEDRRVYLTDCKTRGSNYLPSGAALRPSRVQLFLYHRLLGEMAAGRLDFATIIARYGLQPDIRFSDAFMAQIGNLHEEIFNELDLSEERPSNDTMESTGAGSHPEQNSTISPESSTGADMIKYRSIQQILPLIQAELRETFPRGTDSLGDLVAIQYRHRADGRLIGNQTFPVDHQALSKYLQMDLAWWLGQRDPDGVPVEEGYKCRMCEFAEGCTWRRKRDEEMVSKSRRKGRAKSSG